MNAILVGIETKQDKYNIDYSLDELRSLALVLDIHTIYSIKQKLDKPTSQTYVGAGKLTEIAAAVLAYNADLVIFNDELSPAQIENCRDALDCDVMDRTFLILKIFEDHAKTKEAKLQVKLAKYLYMLPRLQFLAPQEKRVSGASSITRGKGETTKELTRRMVETEIVKARKELNELEEMKDNQIEKRRRNDLPIVSLVGYTNAGKSSTMNTILKYIGVKEDKEVLEKDQLFATLSTYNRKINYKKTDFLLVDTVGFVSKLPHNLVASFYQTLAEIRNSDLIIHVLDTSSEYIQEQLNVVMTVLLQLNAIKIPQIILLNKWDETQSELLSVPGFKTIKFSNKTGLNTELLLDTIVENIKPSTIHAKILLPYSKGDLANLIETKAEIIQKNYKDDGIYYEIEIPKKLYFKVKDYDLDMLVS